MVDLRSKWRGESWEEMAQQNPLAAIMTTPEMFESTDLSEERLEVFFARGRNLLERNLLPLPETGVVVDFGCGAGRILKAVHDHGLPCAGIDISPTMVELCSRFVPGAEAYVFSGGPTPLKEGCASLVYSYAVVQHIQKLSDYLAAFDEMCRLVGPGGRLRVQVACDDFQGSFENSGRTENHEDYSIHYPASGESYRRDQDNWQGVTIDHSLQEQILAERGLTVEGWRTHSGKSLSRVVWISATRPS